MDTALVFLAERSLPSRNTAVKCAAVHEFGSDHLRSFDSPKSKEKFVREISRGDPTLV